MFGDVVSGLAELTDSALDSRIGELELARREIEGELAVAIALADARRVFQADAHRSMKGYLKATCNWSDHEVKRWRSAAKAVNALSLVGDAWISGRIGAPQVALLASTHGNERVREALPGFLAQLVANAEEMCLDDFAMTVANFVALADADGSHEQRDDAIEHRRAHVVKCGDGLDLRMFGGDGINTDEIISVFEAFCDAEYQNDLAARRDLHGHDAHNHDLARTAAQTLP